MNSTMLTHLKTDINRLANPAKAAQLQRFFKTGHGQYGEGDKFLGLTVPVQRQLVTKYSDLKLADIQKLLQTNIHEYRLTALLILVQQYQKTKDDLTRTKIVKFYLNNTSFINNWDLVDLSAPNILGDYLLTHDRRILYKLAKSKNLWEKRIAILATLAFIRRHEFADTLALSKILLTDDHDLIHKAVGWMLREMGKRDLPALLSFLDQHAHRMPRTMLRYAIEKLPEKKRQSYLKK